MAHDRSPPPGYLNERGVNIEIAPAARTLDEALARAAYAVQLAPHLWAPFSSQDHDWVERAFRGLPYYHLPPEAPERAVIAGREVIAVRRLLDCEREPEDWTLEGLTCTFAGGAGQAAVAGHGGRGWLSSYGASTRDAATGSAASPDFTARRGSYLSFKVAGGDSRRVGVKLVSETGRSLAVWRGQNTEQLRTVVHDLTPYAGRTLHVEVFDRDPHGWGHVLADDVMILDTGEQAPSQVARAPRVGRD